MTAPAAPVTDAELTARVADGDRGALASLYERYAEPLYDFAARTTRDRDIAADVVQNTFEKAWGSLQQRPPPDHPKAWLYAIARNDATDELRRRSRTAPASSTGTEFDEFMAIEPAPADDPQRAVEDQEMAALVWSAAGALNPNNYALLDMHLRQDLSVEEMAWTLGVSSQSVYKKMSRMRAALDEAVGDDLLRRNRGECEELDQIVSRFSTDELTPSERRAISKHVRSCEICQERKKKLVAPSALFSRFAALPLVASLRDQIFSKVRTDSSVSPAAPIPPGLLGRLRNWWQMATSNAKAAASILAAALLIGAIVLAVVVFGGGGTVFGDPGDARSSTHQVGLASADTNITITWTRLDEIDGFSIVWDEAPDTLPDQTVDISGTAGSVSSGELLEGDWYFHLRTRHVNGEWTSTIHLGPFLIRPAEAATTTTSTTSSTTTTTMATTTTSDPTADVVGTFTYNASYGEPTGGCGYGPFTDTITITLNPDGSATLEQRQHLSVGTWRFEDGELIVELVLESEFPETYELRSQDLGATFSGINTYQDGTGCVTTFPVTAERTEP